MGTLRESQRVLIEKTGVLLEGEGLSPAEGRIVGLLLVADNLEQTFEEIGQALGLSKSAVSNGLNSLIRQGRIEYITRPGDRKRYFRSNIFDWPKFMKRKFDMMLYVKENFIEILQQRDPSTVVFNESLRDLVEFMNFMDRELPILLKKWKDSRKP